ncbi:zinc ribbon domain-containing protein [Desulfofundulus salinus]|uniref:Zinc ribbon domain-containing protein n=1 Tax=Desulfofundulus salinus TaxID=2419843 RepID=A0A494WYF8_9FIRM|nr:zinc ribbon domain-containing protein [Desulfofundulus salinum]RKO65945.1 zinc ribbon domain-containing protein [Desulfofundulus salinum]
MEIFQKIGETAKGLSDKAKEVTRRSGEFLEATRLKFELSRLEKELENNFLSLGELVYRRYKGEEGLDGEIERLCQSTRGIETDMLSIQEQIDRLQPKPLVCPQCKIELPTGGKFCSYCGNLVASEKLAGGDDKAGK